MEAAKFHPAAGCSAWSRTWRAPPRHSAHHHHQLLARLLLGGCTSPRTNWHTKYRAVACCKVSSTHSSTLLDMGAEGTGLPSTFRLWIATSVGNSFREVATLQQVPLQQPGPGQVLVKMHYAGINGGCETFRARGEFAFRRKATATASVADGTSASTSSRISGNNNDSAFDPGPSSSPDPPDSVVVPLGAEGAGVVVAVGPNVKKLKVGQPVAVNASAAFSEYCLAAERLVTAVPTEKVGAEAAVLALSGMTAICALEGTAKMRAGEVLVVTAAAGGTGHLAVQLGLLAGCHVVAVCGGAAKMQRLQALRHFHGSLTVLDHTVQDIGAELQRLHPTGVDVVYEGVGGLLRKQLLPHLKPGGRFLQVGYISEYPHTTGYPAAGTLQAAGESDSTNAASIASHVAAATSASSWHDAVQHIPPAWQMFWGSVSITGLPEDRAVYGQVWPKDVRTLLRCKTKLYELAYDKHMLDIWVADTHGLRGLQHIPDAVDYMLQGGHTGKLVLARLLWLRLARTL